METAEALAVAALLITLIIYKLQAFFVRPSWRRLPPGTMGRLPLIGETLQYARPNHSLLPGSFLSYRIQRYGKLFKSHLFGDRIIVSADATVNHFILQREGVLFKSSYPGSLLSIIGKQNTTEIHGEVHKAIRNAVLNVVGARIRSDQILSFISAQILKRMKTWEGRVVRFQEEASKISFSLAINQLMSITLEQADGQYLFHNFEVLFNGLLRVPINLPFTPFRQSIKARENVMKLIEKIILEKKSKPQKEVTDVLDGLLTVEGSTVTHDIIIDVMVGVIFAAYETTASIFTFATKFITEHPQVLKELQEEHACIFNQTSDAKGNKQVLTWEHYKMMSFTEKVIKETLRLANVGDVVFREALKDVDINGFTIPKGWKVMPSFIPGHMDGDKFSDPSCYNPWRWDQEGIGSGGDFMPFGGGPRQCAGKDLAKLEVALFIHHLVTKCRWEQVEEDIVIRSRGAKFVKGLPLYFRECKCDQSNI